MHNIYLFDRITIIGLGLVGGSIARAVRKHKLAETIVGCDTNEVSLTFARSSNVIDIAMSDLATAVRDSQLIIIATPPATMGTIAKKIAPGLRKGALVMDTASVKLPVMSAIGEHLPSHADYIPAHPIAGSEQSGISAGRADLFEGKRIIVTPNEPLQEQMLQTITSFWSAMGARVEGVPPDLHDMIYAYISHLPQLLAFATRPIIAEAGKDETLAKFLRLQSSDPKLWTEIFLLNRSYLLKALDRYLDALCHIKDELTEAPPTQAKPENDALTRQILFPRIAASCLITTVMEAEKQAGFPLGRFLGNGFSDFTAPAAATPEPDIERISHHYVSILNVLEDYVSILKTVRDLIAAGDAAGLSEAL